MIRCEKVSCGYGNKTVIEGLSWHLAEGENLTILGANGSGKSTLAKAIAGLVPYSGSITVQGEEIGGMALLKRAQKVGYIPAKLESYDQFTTVEDFIVMGRFAHKRPYKDYSANDRTLALEVMQELGIEAIRHNRLHDLSSGQQQLVLIAQALVQQSRILIFDEPTANLDPKNTQFFARLFKKLQQTHTTILITHDLSLAATLGNRVLFIDQHQGRLFSCEAFFKPENLQHCYGVPFHVAGSQVGVRYE